MVAHGQRLLVKERFQHVAPGLVNARTAFHGNAALKVLAHVAGVFGGLQVDLRDVGARLRNSEDQALLSQAHQGLAHRGAPQAQRLLQQPGGELLPGGQLAEDDVLADFVVGNRLKAAAVVLKVCHNRSFDGVCRGGRGHPGMIMML